MVHSTGFAAVKHQFAAIACANLITLSHGCVLGWLSPFLPLLQSEHSPLATGAVTLEQASWIGAIICVGGVLGNFVFGVLVTQIGCKQAIGCLAFPQVVSKSWSFEFCEENDGIYYRASGCALCSAQASIICMWHESLPV